MNILLTGASSGIGKELVKNFSSIVFTTRNEFKSYEQ
jgi:short-subunit dehydrogenase